MDGNNPAVLLAFLGPKIPMMLKTALFHTISLSHTSSKWDLRTELIIKVLRAELSQPKPMSVTKQQRLITRDPGVKGHMWVSRVTMPAPSEDDLRQTLLQAIDDMKEGGEQYAIPEPRPVEAEWHAYRAHVKKDTREPAISEEEKYQDMMKEVKNDAVVMYFHGGAYYLMDPATHRPATVKYAKLLNSRVFSVRYRLAPQNPFPAALLDALVAYLSLLYPPPGSVHEPVPAEKIIIGGDSAGGNLVLVLIQTILQLHRSSPGQIPKVVFHGREVEVPLPGGLTLSSPWADITRAMPSIESNAHYDFLPAPHESSNTRFPPCEAWPANPARVDLYCEGNALVHPLVSPLAAKDWTNCPPTYFMIGEEMMADESKVLAQRMAKQGVKVVWQQFEAMPHTFPLMLEGNPSTRLCYETWREFCEKALEKPEALHSSGEFITAKSLACHKVDVQHLTEISDEVALKFMRDAQKRLCEGIDHEGKTQALL